MRFHLGEIPEDDTFNPEKEGWIRLREPSAGMLMFAAVPLGIAMAAAVVSIWYFIMNASPLGEAGNGFSFTITLPILLVCIVILIGFGLLHELLHAVPILLTRSWDDLLIGFWPRHLSAYFATFAPVSRNLQLASGALPLFALTLLPMLLAVGFSSNSPWLVVLSSLNAAASGADLIILVLYAQRIPNNAVVRNQGYSTWWKKPTK